MITFFLPASSLSLNFPPWVLASSKSGAFWPTCAADATPVRASSQNATAIAWMVLLLLMNAPFRVDSARGDTLAQRPLRSDGSHGPRALTSESVHSVSRIGLTT